ncbi:chromate efflux transporter [Trinickia caryophylli]|uniref:chromate efflux transporter n=2 Tax=Trinickia caryophylli TaxID=28094 RepID=UPI000A15CF0E
MRPAALAAGHRSRHAFEVFAAFLKLGLTSFGGPVAHLGYFRREFVERRRWLDDAAYSDLVGLCQFLPGPASSQVGFSIGLARAGWAGGIAAWCGFTLPSVLLLIAFAIAAPDMRGGFGQGLAHGLKLTAVAIVAQAVWDMGRRLCPDARRTAIALAAAALVSTVSSGFAQLAAIVLGAVAGLALGRVELARGADAAARTACAAAPHSHMASVISRRASLLAFATFCLLLAGMPLVAGALRAAAPEAAAMSRVFDAFFRSGALVFGGGHVVLPLLQHQPAIAGAVGPDVFLSGYGAAQAVPGPLFSFAAFLGWVMVPAPLQWAAAALATIVIFLPGLLLVVAALPHWQSLRARPAMAAVFAGVNAAVVGVLGAALYSPVWTSAVLRPVDFAIAAIGFFLLVRWKAPPLLVVALCAAAGIALAAAH